jgi:3-phosphoshikimate 1-carboxyvinyltransferase
MMIAPLLPDGLTIELDGPRISESYVLMTASIMSIFGAQVEVSDTRVHVSPGVYVASQFAIEPDFSSAAFPIAAVVIAGGRVRVPELASASLQGDSRILDIATSMGATVEVDGSDVVVSRSAEVEVSAVDIDMSDCSDLVPAVAMMCASASGTSTLTGVGFIRHKESDRLGDLATEMHEIGARVDVLADGLVIHGVDSFGVGRCETHHDHRLAMALSLGALTAEYVDICDSDVVSKSWPSYWESMSDIIGSEATAS